MSGEGMVAVVQSLRDARLAVTVVDGSRNKFSLVPNAAERVMQPQNHNQKYQIQYQQNTSSATDPPNLRCDSSAQATDGRYASMYQTTHGNVEPTSPPCEVTEFPPQRVELCPGRENFEVGGLGSGETCRIPIRPQQGPYRCGTGWVGGGTMFSPRSSQQSDAFASSLRKYPTSSPDRSSELLERLVTYSQAKNFSRYQGRCSPNRCPATESDVYQYAERSPRRNRWEEMRSRTRIDEYPTRDGRPRKEECERRIYNRTYDVRCVREVPRTKDSFRPNEFYQHDVRDGFSMPVYPRKFGMPTSVHTETQSISMCSKEVATVPRSAPVKKNVAVPRSASVSTIGQPEGAVSVIPSSTQMDQNAKISSSQMDQITKTSSSQMDHNAKISSSPMHKDAISSSQTDQIIKESLSQIDCDTKISSSPMYKITKTNSSKMDQMTKTSSSLMDQMAKISLAQMNQNTKIISFKSVQTTSSSMEITSVQKNVNPRKSKSEDDLKKQYFQEGIVDLIRNMAVKSKVKDNVLNENILRDMWLKLHRLLENVEKQNSREKALINLGKKMRKTPIYIPVRYESVRDCTRPIMRKWAEMDVYCGTPPIPPSVEDKIENIVKEWVNSLPFQTQYRNGSIDVNKMSDDLLREVLKLLTSKTKINCESLKRKIVNIISVTPIEVTEKINVLHSLADALVSQLRDVAPNIFKKRLKMKFSLGKTHIHPTEGDIKDWVTIVIADFIKKYDIELNAKDIKEIKTELIEALINFIYGDSYISENVVKEDIVLYLSDYNIKEDQSMDLANALFDQINKRSSSQTKYGNRNFIVYYNTYVKKRPTSYFDASEKFKYYKSDLCEQIDEWLIDLPVEICKFPSIDARETAIEDLAQELVDRQIYLEFNSSKISDENELEYLKYQIYKWISKVVGEENNNVVRCASDLMEKIREIPVPRFKIHTQNVQNVEVNNTFPSFRESINASYIVLNNSNDTKHRHSILKPNSSNQTLKNVTEQNQPYSECTQKTPARLTLQSINEEYDEYVKHWVQQIPIPASNPQEKELSEKLRLGVQNGIWKALTKLKFDPVTFHNTFYYQDLLDDEIESLLNCLPKSPELDARKHLMKAQLLEHTSNTNGKLLKLAEPASFKQNLVENVENRVPRSNIDGNNDAMKLHEDLQILSIVEDYILLTKYDEDNKVKANAFRRKLLKHVEAFVEELKKTHGKELKDIDIGIYMNDIMEALHNVPLPSDDSLKEEADEIILGIEIEHWFDDLPIIPNDDYFEKLQRRRLRESLTKKITDIEKSNLSTCAAESAVKNEIKNFLHELPMKMEDVINIKFFADELSNRIKNKKREQGRRRSVVFQNNLSYQEMPRYSTYNNQPRQYQSLPYAPAKCQSVNQNNISLQLPTHQYQDFKYRKEFPNTPEEKYPVQYHPTPNSNPNMNNSSLAGGGMMYNTRAMNTTVDETHDYHGFEGNRPLSSSMFSLPPNIYGNTIPQHSEQWLNVQGQNQYPKPYSEVSHLSDPGGSWVSLEQVPIPDELKKQLQADATNQRQVKSFVYTDSQSMPHSSHCEQNNGSCCANRTENASLPQVIQDQISKINDAAFGRVSNSNQCANMSQADQVPEERIQFSDGMRSRPRVSFHNTSPNRGVDNENMRESMMQPNQPCNQSNKRRSNVSFDLTARNARSGIPEELTQQNLSNHTREESSSVLKTGKYGQRSAQNISEMGGENKQPSQLNVNFQNDIPTNAPLDLHRLPVPDMPQFSRPQEQEQNQPEAGGSSYGQPQGYSTPNQETNERSAPRIGRKTRDPMRFRQGSARRRLDLNDSDDFEEDCPCMAHFKRRPYGDLDYPCFYPFPYPFPCFF